MLLIMSILMFIFLICEIIVFSSIGETFKNGFFAADNIGILIVAILFIVSFILSSMEKNIVAFSIARTIITIFAWFVGFGLRSFGIGGMDHDKEFIPFLVIRLLLLFIAIPFSFMNYKNSSFANPSNLA